MAAEDPSAPAEQPRPAPSAAPASPTPSLLPPGLVFADTYSRIAAYMLDALLLSVAVSIPPAVLGMYDYAYIYPPEPMPRATFIGTTVFGLAVQAAYFLWFWTGGRRATPGQRVFGLQLGNAFDGRPLTMTQAITRWLAMGWWAGLLLVLPWFAIAVGSYLLVFVGWWLVLLVSMIVSPTKQGIHDRIARSALVRPAGPTSRWAIGCVWLYVGLVVVLGLLLVALFALVSAMDAYYPPGADPFDQLAEQIREFWPS